MSAYVQKGSEHRPLNGCGPNQAPGSAHGYGYGNRDYDELVGASGGGDGDVGRITSGGLDDLHDEMARMKLSGFDISKLPPPSPRSPTSSKGSSSPKSESSGYTPQPTPTRCGSRPNIDSHSRLFGAPDQPSSSRKANHMKSDIFGIGTGSIGGGSGDDQRWDHRKQISASKVATDDKPGFEGGQGDCPEYGRDPHYNKEKEEAQSPGRGAAPASVIPAGARLDAPMIHARENGGNPVTGTGYHEEERVQRRRQFPKTQFMTSKFW